MDWSLALEIVSTVALVAAGIFAGYQLVELRRQRGREAVRNLVASFQNADFSTALSRVNSLPDDADSATIRRVLGRRGRESVFLVGLTWEGLGALAYHREVDLATVEDFFSGGVTVSWRKLRTFVAEDRRALGRETVWEWFQWLAERMAEHEDRTDPVPAYLAHRGAR